MKCVECGKEFEPKAPNQLCCSSECRRRRTAKQNLALYRAKKKYVEYKPKKCKYCGKEFTPTTANQRYCSKECRVKCDNNEYKRRRSSGKIVVMDGYSHAVCPVCGKEFYYTSEHAYRRNKKIFCSWGCLSRYDRDTGINLYEYYRKCEAIRDHYTEEE